MGWVGRCQPPASCCLREIKLTCIIQTVLLYRNIHLPSRAQGRRQRSPQILMESRHFSTAVICFSTAVICFLMAVILLS